MCLYFSSSQKECPIQIFQRTTFIEKLYITVIHKIQTRSFEMKCRASILRNEMALSLDIDNRSRNFCTVKTRFIPKRNIDWNHQKASSIINFPSEDVRLPLVRYAQKVATHVYEFSLFDRLTEALLLCHDHTTPSFFETWRFHILPKKDPWAWKDTWSHMIPTKYKFHYDCI